MLNEPPATGVDGLSTGDRRGVCLRNVPGADRSGVAGVQGQPTTPPITWRPCGINLAQSLGDFGLGIVCAGSHPLAAWREQTPTVHAHFEQLFEDVQQVARRSVLCGLHVHVQVPEQLDRIAVMNEVSPWLPLLLLLSCSSPFWEGAPSGFMSYRQAACDEWPRMGVPEHFEDWAAYQRCLGLLRRMGVIKADGNGWWGIRPAAPLSHP